MQTRKRKPSRLKVAGMVTLYNPTDADLKNIATYIDDVDKLYIIDNTEGNSNKSRIPQNKKIEYIFKNKNIGIAGALNLAAKKAIKDGYNWLLTNDQDTTFRPGVMKKLKQEIQKADANVGIVTPWHNTKLKDKKPDAKYDDPHDVMTSGNMLNLSIWKKLGGFKEWLFIDGVDIEYCMNLHKNGYKILRVNELEIDHTLGDLFYRTFRGKLFLCTNHPAIRRYYIMRNYHYIHDMYLSIEPGYCNALIEAQRHNLKGAALFEKKKISKLMMYLRGYIDYKKGIKGKYVD